MFQATQREIYIAGVRYEDLLAKAARARLVAAATEKTPSDHAPAIDRFRASLRRAAAWLFALTTIG